MTEDLCNESNFRSLQSNCVYDPSRKGARLSRFVPRDPPPGEFVELAEVKQAEREFRDFVIRYTACPLLVVILCLIDPSFRSACNNRAFPIVMAYLAFGSYLQSNFFDIKRKCNPTHIKVKPEIFSPLWSVVERAFTFIVASGMLTATAYEFLKPK